jgi:hypothetical protein
MVGIAARIVLFPLVIVLALAARIRAEEAFFDVPLEHLKLTQGALPPATQPNPENWQVRQLMTAYAVIEGDGEAIVWSLEPDRPNQWQPMPQFASPQSLALLVRVPQARDVRGRLYVLRADTSGMDVLVFEIPRDRAKDDDHARQRFYRAQLAYYEDLLRKRYAGAAWFRYRAAQVREALGEQQQQQQDPNQFRGWPAGSTTLDTYELFSGGRAISENLQLDRELPVTDERARATIDASTIPGITVTEIDWKPLVKNLNPKLDSLASCIPHDQHAIFFPSLEAAIAMIETSAAQGTPVLRLAEPRSEDAKTRQRYERQLGIPLDELAKLLGPLMIESVAATGSDPYLRTGSDLAVLFETSNPAALRAALRARIEASRLAHGSAQNVEQQIEGVDVSGARSVDRSMSSYIARVGDSCVVVTNSPAQLERIIRAHREKQTLASLDEYRFFRNRYPLGGADETAFLMLSDATIRRWCGPQWRIGASRRTRAAAIMSELQATYMDQLAQAKIEAGPIHTQRPHPDIGELRLTSDGVTSSVYGSLDFLTPIAELDVSKVTEEERVAYGRWRQNYQSRWRWAFDPIAARLAMKQDRLEGDLTVMPLIWGSEYRHYIGMSRGASINPAATDHHDALLHAAISINRQSEGMRGMINLGRNFAPGLGADPLAWMGPTVSLYIDDAELWDRPRPDDGADAWVEVPVVLLAENKDSLKLTMFLAAVRAFVDQTAPEMTQWESLKHGEHPYVKVSASPRARAEGGPAAENIAVYYAPGAKTLTIALSEQAIKRSLDRLYGSGGTTQPATQPATQPTDRPWLGENLCLQIDRRFIDRVMHFWTGEARHAYEHALRERAWSNLPILNEWKHRYPGEDPVAMHERLWKTKLVSPLGGEYVWNDRYQTMESTIWGHPGEPKSPDPIPRPLAGFGFLNFGLTFEDQGLRARAVLWQERER